MGCQVLQVFQHLLPLLALAVGVVVAHGQGCEPAAVVGEDGARVPPHPGAFHLEVASGAQGLVVDPEGDVDILRQVARQVQVVPCIACTHSPHHFAMAAVEARIFVVQLFVVRAHSLSLTIYNTHPRVEK